MADGDEKPREADQSGDAALSPLFPFGGLFGFEAPAPGAFGTGADAIARMTGTSQALARFWVQRMKADVAAAQSMATSRTPQDAFAVWTGAASQAMRDYGSLFDRLAEINGRGAAAPGEDKA